MGALDVLIYRYDRLAQRYEKNLAVKLAEADQKRKSDGSYDLTEAERDSLRKELLRFNYLMGVIFDNQAEIGRALNAMKMLEFTRRKVESISASLDEYAGANGLAESLMDDAVFDKLLGKLDSTLKEPGDSSSKLALTSRHAMKPYMLQYILTINHAFLLSGLGTTAINTYENLAAITRDLGESGVATGLSLSGRAVGKDAGISAWEAPARSYGLLRAFADASTWRNAYIAVRDGPSATPQLGKSKIRVDDARIAGLSKVNDFLYAQDVFFRAFHQNANLYALGVRKAKEEGYEGFEVFSEGAAIAMNPTEEMIKRAKYRADEALYVDKTGKLASKLDKYMKWEPNMSNTQKARVFGLRFFLPFLPVTDRILANTFIKRGPLFMLDEQTRLDVLKDPQKSRADITNYKWDAEAVTAYSRALWGSAMLLWYWHAAKSVANLFVGEDEEEDQEKGQMTNDGFMTGAGAGVGNYQGNKSRLATGAIPGAITKDDKFVDITRNNLGLFPGVPLTEYSLYNAVANSMAVSRRTYEQKTAQARRENDPDKEISATTNAINTSSAVLAGALSYLRTVNFAEGVTPFIQFAEEAPNAQENSVSNLAKGLSTRVVPAAVRQYNRVVQDPIKRNTRGDGSIGDAVKNTIAASLPGLSQDLPAQIDTLGQTIPTNNTWSQLFNESEAKSDPVARELGKLQQLMDESIVGNIGNTMEIEGVDYEVPAELQEQYARDAGNFLSLRMSAIFSNEESLGRYRRMPRGTKKEYWEKQARKARALAKRKILPQMIQLNQTEITNRRRELEQN